VHLRNFFDKKKEKKGFKGSVFVTFDSKEDAEKFFGQEKVTNVRFVTRCDQVA